MTKCEQCGARIVFGGARYGGHLYCSEPCRSRGIEAVAQAELPEGFVLEKAMAMHLGRCPQCGGAGPVDVHTSYRIAAIAMHMHMTATPEICCLNCGKRAKRRAIRYCLLMGWWGPLGLIGIPLQVLRNLRSGRTTLSAPSQALVAMVRQQLTATLMGVSDSPAPGARHD